MSLYHYDGLGSTRFLSDAGGAVTDWYDYAAFGEALNQIGGTENLYLFAGEQFDTSLEQYYLRARYYDQAVGRFTQMDAWVGANQSPITLHKYLYANVDPINMIDPSGNMSIANLGAVINVLSTTLSRLSFVGMRAARFYSKLDTALTLYHGRSALMRVISMAKTGGYQPDKDFANALADSETAVATLIANIGRVYRRILKGTVIKDFIDTPKNHLLVYGPIPEKRKAVWFPPNTRIPIGKMRLGKSSRKILVEFGKGGRKGGRFAGLGHTQGNTAAHKWWFRMDWHKPDGNEDWISGNYHFHVNKE